MKKRCYSLLIAFAILGGTILTGCYEEVSPAPPMELQIDSNVWEQGEEDVETDDYYAEVTKTSTTSVTVTTTAIATTTTTSIATTTTPVLMTTSSSTTTSTTSTSKTTGYSTTTQTSTVSTTAKTKVTTTTTKAPTTAGVKDLPSALQKYVNESKEKYPGMHIGCGVFDLTGQNGYAYNMDEEISSACTIKAPYAMFVLKTCDEQNISIWQTKLKYESWMRNTGSGIIKNQKVGNEYTIAYLLEVLLSISDNTAYNILVSKFPLKDFQEFLNGIGGQNMKGFQYGSASVRQRWNEWIQIWNYVNSSARYAETLKNYTTNTKYCYLTAWMKQSHTYMHKSGWSNGKGYTSAADCAIIDGKYLIVVITADYSTGVAHADVVKGFGLAVENYVSAVGGTKNLF